MWRMRRGRDLCRRSFTEPETARLVEAVVPQFAVRFKHHMITGNRRLGVNAARHGATQRTAGPDRRRGTLHCGPVVAKPLAQIPAQLVQQLIRHFTDDGRFVLLWYPLHRLALQQFPALPLQCRVIPRRLYAGIGAGD